MGKDRSQKRHKLVKEEPTGLPSVKEMERECEINGADMAGIDTVMEKLSSTCLDDKEYGCAALSAYISSKDALNKLLDRNAVRLITPLLQEKKVSLQLAASSLLRGMSEEGGFEACERMIRQDVFTGLTAVLRERVGIWQSSQMDVKSDGYLHSFVNCIYTVQNLCECSALAVRLSIEDSVPQVLLSVLNVEKYSATVLLAAAQCLYTLSEENQTVSEFLQQTSNSQTLTSLLRNDKVLLYTRVIIAGVQFNTYGFDVLSKESEDIIPPLLLSALNIDTYDNLCDIVFNSDPSVSSPPTSTGACEMEQDDIGEEKHSTNLTEGSLRKDLEVLDNQLSAQKLSFEIITNLLAADDTEEWADIDADDDTSCGTADSDCMEDEDMEPLPDNSIATTLVDEGLIYTLRHRLHFTDSALYGKVANTDKLHRSALQSSLQRYDSMLASALLCLNNTLSQVKLDKFGGVQSLQSMLKLLLAALSTPQIVSQEMLVESITSAMRSLMEQLSANSENLSFDEEELNTLQKLIMAPHTATAVNALRCVTAVGVSLSKQSTPNPIVKAIGSLLLEVITTSKQLWLVTESLDSIMDVFAEDINNIYIKELGVISTLQEILPQLKTMVSQKDRTETHFLPVLATVKSNLPRFIKYKLKVL
ncbi:hypothetical protein EB796_022795 [Bugula neritina]|uniref:SYO1-like TPR repeats domain-containing protein n=1 Tax=Bugula neritina TaxID=10212 RepID=A0A7J7IYG9_BUGNE|nr:hypothetical protein EB796_022795 [Bugula neritina]